MAVELQARQQGARVDPADFGMRLTRDDWIRSLAFFAPLAGIVYCLRAGFSVNRAGFWAIFLTQLSARDTPILAVHLFVLYFGALSPVTPR